MALRCTVSALKRPEEVRKPQQGLAARFKLCGRKPLRGLPPSPRWTWRCALREANVRKGLGGYTRSSGTYLGRAQWMCECQDNSECTSRLCVARDHSSQQWAPGEAGAAGLVGARPGQ